MVNLLMTEAEKRVAIEVKPLKDMKFIARVSSGNYLNIPSDLRKALNLQEGQVYVLRGEMTKGGICIHAKLVDV